MNNDAAIFAILFGFIFFVGLILMAVFYLLTLQNVLKEVSPNNRQVPPSNVWLMFIPLFNLIYPFILYPKISDSVKEEYRMRELRPEGDFSRSIGITLPILALCGIIPFLGILAGIANFILWIIFWVKMSEYKSMLVRTRGRINSQNMSISNNTDILD